MSENWRGVGASALRFGPRVGGHRVALRAGFCVAAPLLVLLGVGRLDLSVFATFGAFASLYGRFERYLPRLRMQASAGGLIVVIMIAASALSASGAAPLVRVFFATAVAGIVTVIATAARWHPPGALFAVFASGACSSIPATGATVASAAIVGTASLAFTLAVTASIAAVRTWSHRRHGAPLRAEPPVRPARAPRREAAWIPPVQIVIAVAIAGTVTLAVFGTHWYWSMVAAVAALGGAHLFAHATRTLQRLVGTLLGVAAAAGILALHLPPLAVIAVVAVCQTGAELFIGRNYGITMLFITPLALLMIELAAPSDPLVLLRDRTIDTLIGLSAGLAVSAASTLLARPRRLSL